MQCPSCQADLADAERECPRCGILVEKWRPRPPRVSEPRVPVAPPKQRASSSSSTWILALAGVVIVGLLATVFFARRTGDDGLLQRLERRIFKNEGLPAVDPPGTDFDLAYQLPGRPQGAASNGKELVIAHGSDPWGALRVAVKERELSARGVAIAARFDQKLSLYTITWNGRNYIGYTTGAWFGRDSEVFTVHDPVTLQVVETHPAPPLLGCLAWDGMHYWASTRKNTRDADEEPFFYKLDAKFTVLSKTIPPGVGCQGLAWDGRALWYVDVFSDTIKVLDVSGGDARVVHSADTPIDYLSGIVFHRDAIWIVEYGKNRLLRLRESTRQAWSKEAPSPQFVPAAMIPGPRPSARTAQYKNSFLERTAEEAEEIEWAVELRDDGIWLTNARLWFGNELFVPREQSSTMITIPIFARYTYTVENSEGFKTESTFEARPGENVLANMKLADPSGTGEYDVSLFIHVQYIDPNGTARILNNSGGFVTLRK